MFIKNTENNLVFIRSKNINAFPCGRRRSNLVDTDGKPETASDRYYIPFDPEARLNTEANNRRHTGLNGFSNSYILDWNETTRSFAFVIAGYLFKVDLDTSYTTVNDFCAVAAGSAYTNADNAIFANIKLREVPFFSGSATIPKAFTEILRDQVSAVNDAPATYLDFSIPGTTNTNADNYYFAGLSLSNEAKDNLITYAVEGSESMVTTERTISLQLFTKNNGIWELHNPSKLPNIKHGDYANSVKIPGDLTVTGSINTSSIDAAQVYQGGRPVALLDIVPIIENGKEVYQLQFTGAFERQVST